MKVPFWNKWRKKSEGRPHQLTDDYLETPIKPGIDVDGVYC